MDILLMIIYVVLCIVCITISYYGYSNLKLEKIKPVRFKVKNFINHDGAIVTPSQASYAILLDGSKVKLREKVSDNEDSILAHYNNKKYLMYRESKINTDTEDLIASLKPTKSSLKSFIIPVVAIISSIFLNTLDNNKTEIERLSIIHEERYNSYKSGYDRDSLTLFSLLAPIIIDSNPQSVTDYQKNIYIIDSLMYLEGRVDTIKFEESNNIVYNIRMRYTSKVTQDALDVMNQFKEGKLTESEAEKLCNKILLPMLSVQFIEHIILLVIKAYCIMVTLVYIFRIAFYVIYKYSTRKLFI